MTQLSTKLPLKLSTSLDNHSAETTSVFYWHLSFTWAPPAEGVSAARLHSRCSPFSPSTRPRPDAQSLAAVGVSPSLTHQCYCGYRGFIAALATGGERRQHLSHPSKKKKKNIFLSLFFFPDYFLLSWSLYLSCLLPPLIAFLYFLLLFTSLHLPSCLLPKIEPSRSLPLVPPHSSFSSAPLSLLHSSTPWLSPPRRIAATQQSSLISRDAASQQNGEVIVPDSWWFYLFPPSSPPVSIHPDSLRLSISSSTPFFDSSSSSPLPVCFSLCLLPLKYRKESLISAAGIQTHTGTNCKRTQLHILRRTKS